jgi:hypothetical protein
MDALKKSIAKKGRVERKRITNSLSCLQARADEAASRQAERRLN